MISLRCSITCWSTLRLVSVRSAIILRSATVAVARLAKPSVVLLMKAPAVLALWNPAAHAVT